MLLLLAYVLPHGLAWVGLISILAGLAAWPRNGAFLPIMAGLAFLLAAARLLLALVRQYIPPADRPRL
jgi:CHASE2 domain-containing sensor protein